MLKFVVVLYRRADLSQEQFHENLRNEHGLMAERLPGLRRYIQNHVVPDPNRPHPGWAMLEEKNKHLAERNQELDSQLTSKAGNQTAPRNHRFQCSFADLR